jgi:enamine deaminase RidA (YjgF/YER057c/UK114 family)
VHIVFVDIADWGAVNAVYMERMAGVETLPARMIAGGSQLLPEGARLEIQAVAARA